MTAIGGSAHDRRPAVRRGPVRLAPTDPALRSAGTGLAHEARAIELGRIGPVPELVGTIRKCGLGTRGRPLVPATPVPAPARDRPTEIAPGPARRGRLGARSGPTGTMTDAHVGAVGGIGSP